MINMLSNDFNLIEMKFNFIFHFLLFIPTITCYGVLFVYRLGFEAFILIGFVILLFPLQIFLNKVISFFIRKMNLAKDERISLTEELVENFKFIKINAWEDHFEQEIKRCREMEIKWLMRLSFIRALCWFEANNR